MIDFFSELRFAMSTGAFEFPRVPRLQSTSLKYSKLLTNRLTERIISKLAGDAIEREYRRRVSRSRAHFFDSSFVFCRIVAWSLAISFFFHRSSPREKLVHGTLHIQRTNKCRGNDGSGIPFMCIHLE